MKAGPARLSLSPLPKPPNSEGAWLAWPGCAEPSGPRVLLGSEGLCVCVAEQYAWKEGFQSWPPGPGHGLTGAASEGTGLALGVCVASPAVRPGRPSPQSGAWAPGGLCQPSPLPTQPVDRDPVVCHPDLEELLQAWPAELPDEFFEVTVDDVRRRLAQLKSERWVCPSVSLSASPSSHVFSSTSRGTGV